MIPYFILLLSFVFTTADILSVGKKKHSFDEFASDQEDTKPTSPETSPSRLGDRLETQAEKYKVLSAQLKELLRRRKNNLLDPVRLAQFDQKIKDLKEQMNS